MEISMGYIEFIEVVKGDMLDVSFDVNHDLDLAGKTLYAEVVADPTKYASSGAVLKFREADASLVKTIVSDTIMTIRLYKQASDMEIASGKYLISIVMGSDPDFEDKQTIIRGKMTVLVEITNRPNE